MEILLHGIKIEPTIISSDLKYRRSVTQDPHGVWKTDPRNGI